MSRTRALLTLLDRLHWLWLALAAPFMLFPSPKRSLAMLVVPGLWLIRLIIFKRQNSSTPVLQSSIPDPRLVVSGVEPSAFPLTPFNAALLLMALMVMVSEWVTFDLEFSLPKISGTVLGFGIFFAVAREGERPRNWWFSLLVFMSIGLGIAALGLLGTHWATTKIAFFNPIIARLPTLIMGLHGAESGFHPNEVAGALGWVLPIFLALSIALFISQQWARFLNLSKRERSPKSRGKKTWRKSQEDKKEGMTTWVRLSGWRLVLVKILCLLTTLFVGAVFVLTQSRGGYMGLGLTLLLLTPVALPRRWRLYSLVAIVLLAILLGFLVASHWGVVQTWVAGNDLASDPALSLNSLKGRLEVWSRAIFGIQDFPFTGMGMNAFRKVMPVLYPLFLVSSDVDIGHAHNELLQAALDLGIPGLIAFIALYIIAFWMLAEIWRNVPMFNLLRATVLGLAGGLLAHMLYGITDAVALGAKPGVLFWMLLGLIAGLYQQMRARESLAAR